MKAKKVYEIKTEKEGREKIVKGSLEELIKYFSYTLEIGASWNPKINRNPKTIVSFISNLQKSYEEKEANCYKRTFVERVN